jgi:tetratricopeptide (TPR) repeat protein
MNMRYSFLWLFLLTCSIIFASNEQEDSLLNIIKTSKSENEKVDGLNSLASYYHQNEFRKAIKTAYEAIEIAEKNNYIKGISRAYYNIGYAYFDLGKKDSTVYFYAKSKELAKEINNIEILSSVLREEAYLDDMNGNTQEALKKYREAIVYKKQLKDYYELATIYSNFGGIYFHSGNYDSAIYYHHKALPLRDSIKDFKGVSTSLLWLGYIYKIQGNIPEALEYYNRALLLAEKLDNKINVGNALNNIASIFIQQNMEEEAKSYLFRGIEVNQAAEYKKGLAVMYNTLARIFSKQDSLENAFTFYEKSYTLNVEIKDYLQTITSSLNMAKISKKLNYVDKVDKYLNQTIHMAKKGNYLPELIQSYCMKIELLMENNNQDSVQFYINEMNRLIKQVNNIEVNKEVTFVNYLFSKNSKKYAEALQFYEKFITLRDSLSNQENQKASIRQQTKYEFEKAQLLKEQQLKEENRKLEEETARRNNIQYSMIFLAILLVFGSVLGLGFVKVSPKFTEGLIFFAFLIFFEFSLVLLDPIIDEWSSGEPIYKLIFNAILAGAIFPLHAFFENLLKTRILKQTK